MRINPLTAIDFYKADHRSQYPEGTEVVYSNFTPRSNHIAKRLGVKSDTVVFFGLQHFIESFLIETFQQNFFDLPKEEVVADYARRMRNALGPDAITVEHIGELHDLGYLPIQIKALPEGSRVAMGVPVLTIKNTLPNFFWLTNYLESVMSCMIWKPCTSATIANEYRQILERFAEDTGASREGIQFQAHDFSFRGMSSVEDAAISGAGHLLSFSGTDTVAAIDFLEGYYGADSDEELVGASVPATEHSVMCMGEKANELGTFRRLVNDLYPAGIVSIVSDTWDFWRVVTEFVSELKEDILARDGKVVIRPDSGDPVKIICGDPEAEPGSPAYKGAVQCLWDVFGGTETVQGFKQLDSHIGLIYGDSITLQRAEAILTGLKEKGFASDNIVFGVGSFTYQYNTRDTFGFAMKATYGEVNGEGRDIFKDPVTDSGVKKSARGLLRVEGGKLYQQQTVEQERKGDLQTVYKNGIPYRKQTLAQIRKRLNG